MQNLDALLGNAAQGLAGRGLATNTQTIGVGPNVGAFCGSGSTILTIDVSATTGIAVPRYSSVLAANGSDGTSTIANCGSLGCIT